MDGKCLEVGMYHLIVVALREKNRKMALGLVEALIEAAATD
jgi:hypothetical protein